MIDCLTDGYLLYKTQPSSGKSGCEISLQTCDQKTFPEQETGELLFLKVQVKEGSQAHKVIFENILLCTSFVCFFIPS